MTGLTARPAGRHRAAHVSARLAVAVLKAVIVLVAIASMLWVWTRPRGLGTMAWLVVMFAVVTGCAVALERLGGRRRKEADHRADA